MRLNPFSIRSAFKRALVREFWGYIGLNPFSIRSAFKPIQAQLPHPLPVLIPSRSGLLSNARGGGLPPRKSVLIPSRSGLLSNAILREIQPAGTS